MNRDLGPVLVVHPGSSPPFHPAQLRRADRPLAAPLLLRLRLELPRVGAVPLDLRLERCGTRGPRTAHQRLQLLRARAHALPVGSATPRAVGLPPEWGEGGGESGRGWAGADPGRGACAGEGEGSGRGRSKRRGFGWPADARRCRAASARASGPAWRRPASQCAPSCPKSPIAAPATRTSSTRAAGRRAASASPSTPATPRREPRASPRRARRARRATEANRRGPAARPPAGCGWGR